VAREAKVWIHHVDEQELAYNARYKGDLDFGAKLLGAIDLAFFNLCDICFRAVSIDDVDFGKNCLSNLRDDIVGNRFHEGMPTYLLVRNKNKRELDEDDQEDGKNGKKKIKDAKDDKDKFKDLGEMVKNTQVVQDWFLPGAKYKALFTRDVIGSTPPFNDSGLITCNIQVYLPLVVLMIMGLELAYQDRATPLKLRIMTRSQRGYPPGY